MRKVEVRQNLEYSTYKTHAKRNYPKTRVGELLATVRTERGEKQRDVAARYPLAFPLGQTTMSAVETHKRMATDEILLMVAEYCEVELAILEQMRVLDEKERLAWRRESASISGRRGAVTRRAVAAKVKAMPQAPTAMPQASQVGLPKGPPKPVEVQKPLEFVVPLQLPVVPTQLPQSTLAPVRLPQNVLSPALTADLERKRVAHRKICEAVPPPMGEGLTEWAQLVSDLVTKFA